MPWHSARQTKQRPTLAALLSYAALSVFIAVFLLLGLFNRAELPFSKKPRYDFPDFDKIQTFRRALAESDVSLHDTHNRVIFMGDVHGMNESLHRMLQELSYNPAHDTIFFAGDLLAKSTHSSSLAVLDFLTQNHRVDGVERIFPVRGNHDQLIVQWRAWREWFEAQTLPSLAPRLFPASTLPARVTRLFRHAHIEDDSAPPVASGREFLQLIEAEWAIARVEDDADPEEYAEVARKRAQGTWREEWWRRIPPPGTGKEKQQWRMFGDHYWLARDMTPEQASYLMSLPLVLHVPHLHLFVVHGGLLPSDPRLPPTDRRQPLAHAPGAALADSSGYTAPPRVQHLLHEETPRDVSASRKPGSERRAAHDLRTRQETALLTDVPQNRDAWVLLNMRSVTRKHKVTRDGDKGTPWSKIWNAQMGACRGFDARAVGGMDTAGGEGAARDEVGEARRRKGKDELVLPCRPATVVYGHAASRGLDVKRWSMGLDTGCLYGRRLTALVLNNGTAARLGESKWGWDDEDDDEGDDEGDDEEDDEDDDDDDDEHEHEHEHDDDEEEDEEEESRRRRKRVQFGDPDSGIDARLFSVKCPNLDDDDD